MRAIVELWLSQLYKLTVLWPAWLLTPQGRRAVFKPRTIWRIALALVFVGALAAMLQAAALPPDFALIGAGDVMAYVDVAVIAWVAGASAVVKVLIAWSRRRGRGPVQVAARRERRTAMRRRGPRRSRPPANDDGFPGGRWTVAA
jgi:hypothetical protein